MATKRGRIADQQQLAPCAGHAADVGQEADLALGVAAYRVDGERHLILFSLSSRQRLHAHHGTRAHGTGKTLDCSHGWRAPATFDACHHALGRAHERGHIALREARLRACCNQFTGQLKLRRLCVIGLANGGVGQQFSFQVFHFQGLFSNQQQNAPVLSLYGHAQAHRQRGSSPPCLRYPAR